jgi:hypothetical protein
MLLGAVSTNGLGHRTIKILNLSLVQSAKGGQFGFTQEQFETQAHQKSCWNLTWITINNIVWVLEVFIQAQLFDQPEQSLLFKFLSSISWAIFENVECAFQPIEKNS